MAGPRGLAPPRSVFGMTHKPNSVTVAGGDHLSGSAVTSTLEQPTRNLCHPAFLIPLRALCTGQSAIPPPRSIDGGLRRRTRVGSTLWFPIWSCTRWGLPCRWCRHQRGALLPHHFTLTAIPASRECGGIFSVALSRAPATPADGLDGWALPTTVPCGVRTFLPAFTERSPCHSTVNRTIRRIPVARVERNFAKGFISANQRSGFRAAFSWASFHAASRSKAASK